MSSGAIAGLVLGLLLIGLGEYRDSSFRTRRGSARVLSIPVLGAHSGDELGAGSRGRATTGALIDAAGGAILDGRRTRGRHLAAAIVKS